LPILQIISWMWFGYMALKFAYTLFKTRKLM
jgi:hypothetical protein